MLIFHLSQSLISVISDVNRHGLPEWLSLGCDNLETLVELERKHGLRRHLD